MAVGEVADRPVRSVGPYHGDVPALDKRGLPARAAGGDAIFSVGDPSEAKSRWISHPDVGGDNAVAFDVIKALEVVRHLLASGTRLSPSPAQNSVMT